MPLGAAEPFLEAALRHAAVSRAPLAPSLRRLCGPLLRRRASARLLLRERFLLTRVLPEGVLPPLLELLGETDALPEAMEGVARAWSAPSHVVHASLVQQRYLTAALLGGMQRLPAQVAVRGHRAVAPSRRRA
eukprot:6850834-Prymnesium_polylepis.1